MTGKLYILFSSKTRNSPKMTRPTNRLRVTVENVENLYDKK